MWPLPSEWATTIPPVAVNINEQEYFGAKVTRPVWNNQWLRGLEAYVRGIVRDEVKKMIAEETVIVEQKVINNFLNKGDPT